MDLVTREEWGALPPKGTSTDFAPQGVTFHYEGNSGSVYGPDHSQCAGIVRGIQQAHLNHPTEDYSDIAYSFLVCMHGSVFEGRGLHVRSGANGTASANYSYYSVCFLIGTSTPFWPTLARGGVDAINYLRQNGAGGEINGHRDHIATACPGTAAYSWVRAGCPLYPEDLGYSVPDGYINHWSYGWLHGGIGLPTEGGPSPQGGFGEVVNDFPGAGYFGPGANNDYVTQLGRMLVARGGARFYQVGPGPVWGDADLKATQAFQQAQGWTGADADGIPGPSTWQLLVGGAGNDIPLASGTAFPGAEYFLPGSNNSYVTMLGQQLVAKGYGRHYTSGPGPQWSEADRLNVRDFQLAQGWTGNDANGYPGPVTWARLFDQSSGSSSQHFPGAGYFGPGANNDYVTELGRMLIARGGTRFYQVGPGPVWGDADLNATQAFQQAQGWTGADADGIPGPTTWQLLTTGTGNNIALPSTAFPGAGYFGPGANNDYVTQLGRMLIARGGTRFYQVGPGPVWGDADLNATQAFQQAQGWTGADADGIPGPSTWQLLVGGTGNDI